MSRRPFWLRHHLSCPDCGFVIQGSDGYCQAFPNGFDCPVCECHYSERDFMELHEDKIAHIQIEKDLKEESTKDKNAGIITYE